MPGRILGYAVGLSIWIVTATAIGAPPNDDCANAIDVGLGTTLFSSVDATTDGPRDCGAESAVWYRFASTCAGQLTASVCDSDFDTILAIYDGSDCPVDRLLSCNDDACGTASSASIFAEAGREYLIVVGGFAGATGQGTLTLHCSAPPANDNCVDAIPVQDGTLAFKTTGATTDGPFDCEAEADIWYRYTASCTGELLVSLCGSEFDTVLGVYQGTACDSPELLQCDDDGCSPALFTSVAVVPVVAGEPYLIRIGGFFGETGRGTLTLQCELPNQNDDCARAVPIADGITPFHTLDATTDGDFDCPAENDKWFSYTASCTGQLTVSLCDSTFDTILGLYEGGGRTCSRLRLAECNDDGCPDLFSLGSSITTPTLAGTRYTIRVGGYFGEVGIGNVSVSCEPCCGLSVGDRVRLRVTDPDGAPGLVRGRCGTVVCCDGENPFEPLLVTWEGWTGGIRSTSGCADAAGLLPAGSGAWMRCGDLEFSPDCTCETLGRPFAAAPSDGANSVATTTVLSWNEHVTAPAPASARPRVAKTIYGDDDRLDEFEVVDPELRAAGDATVVMVALSDLIDNGDDTYSLPPTTLGESPPSFFDLPLCRGEPYRNQPIAGLCSGFLVGTDIVATAGHCIFDEFDCANTAFIFGYVMLDASTPVLTVPASEVYFCREIIDRVSEPAGADWGLHRLDRPVVGHTPLRVRTTGRVADQAPLVLIGYALGLPRKYAGGGTIRDNSPDSFFVTTLDSFDGNSGAAVLNAETRVVEGILVRGDDDFEVARGDCLRSFRCENGGCTGEDVTRATQFSAFLPRFDVYFGRCGAPLEPICTDTPIGSCDPGPLEPGAIYRWQVVAKNACGDTAGPIWRFTVARDAAPGDADRDGDIDLADLLALQECISTGGADNCSHFDMDADCDVDLADYLTFVSHFTGSR